jgi:hypothetical protein
VFETIISREKSGVHGEEPTMTAIFALFVIVAFAVQPGAYMDIFGDDSNDGLTAQTAVKTLGRAYQGWEVAREK